MFHRAEVCNESRERDRPSLIARTRNSRFSLTLTEGKKRQIRRAMRALGHPVVRLVRVRMGPIELGELAAGEARPLRARERRALLATRRPDPATRARN